jgi:putative nucleotidyltransferase with HDIG domain
MLPLAGEQKSNLELRWLEDALPSEGEQAAARSLAARMGEFEGLRPFPAVVQELVAYVSQPDFKIERVRQMIESDPALASRLMRVANSVAYRTYESCTTIAHAIMRVGATNLAHLSMALAAMTFFKDLDDVGMKIRDHSAGTAAIARELAFRLGRNVVSSKVLLAGLLHDVGKLLLIQAGDHNYSSLLAQEHSADRIHRIERITLGFDHAMLGGQVLARWNLPKPLPQIVARHHHARPSEMKPGIVPMSIAILRLADQADWMMARSCDPDLPALRNLSLSPDGVYAGLQENMMIELWDDLRAARAETRSLFR